MTKSKPPALTSLPLFGKLTCDQVTICPIWPKPALCSFTETKWDGLLAPNTTWPHHLSTWVTGEPWTPQVVWGKMCSGSDQSERKTKTVLRQRLMLTTFQIRSWIPVPKITIDSKKEKWKLLLGEACHDVLAGDVLGLNPAAARLGSASHGARSKGRAGSPKRSAFLPVSSPAPLTVPGQWIYAQYLCCSLTPRWEGWEETRRETGQHGDGLGKERLQKAHSRLRLCTSWQWAPL